MLHKTVAWLGIEANSRAITTLLAIGGAVGATLYFLIETTAPLLSPALSQTDYGEGYRRGYREAELESQLIITERQNDVKRLQKERTRLRQIIEIKDRQLKIASERPTDEELMQKLRDGTF